MVLTDGDNYITNIDLAIKASAIAIGMGMGIETKTTNAFANFLKSNSVPLVIDADGLNVLAANKELLKDLPKLCILTPHPGELERLVGKWKDDFDKLDKVKKLSKKLDCIIVIKGAHSITVYHDKGFVTTTGNPGMATAGSGDVLSGIISGLIAQGYEPLKAAIFGVYLHGKSADLQIENTGYQSLIASDIVEGLGAAYLDLFKLPEAVQQQNTDTQEKK
jgi:hydroxyethylthiazole kinase-like uncharacterized protein yjeF